MVGSCSSPTRQALTRGNWRVPWPWTASAASRSERRTGWQPRGSATATELDISSSVIVSAMPASTSPSRSDPMFLYLIELLLFGPQRGITPTKIRIDDLYRHLG